MSRRLVWVLGAALAAAWACGLDSTALAAPIEWPVVDGGNGHYYEVVIQPSILFADAKAAAAARTYQGVAGYLATVNLAGEATFIYNKLTGPAAPTSEVYAFWLGAETESSSVPWRWVTGEQVLSEEKTYPGETWYIDYFADYGTGWGLCHFVNSWWTSGIRPQDTARTNPSGIYGYVVEYPVPEPASLTLLAIGGALLRRRCAA